MTLHSTKTNYIAAVLFLFSVSITGFAEQADRFAQGMQVVITGAGFGQFTERGGSGAAVIVDGTVLQFDAGPRTKEHLHRSGVLPNHKIDYLFFTHLHGDHTSDYLNLFYWRNEAFQKDIKVFGPTFTSDMVKDAYAFTKARRKDFRALMTINPKSKDALEKMLRSGLIDVQDIAAPGGVVLDQDGIKVTAIEVPHMKAKNNHSFAYRVDSRYGSVVISGDTAPSMNTVALAKNADLLIHEVTRPDQWMDPEHYKGREGFVIKLDDAVSIAEYKTTSQSGHTTPAEAGKVAQRAKVKKLVTYHSPPFTQTLSERKRLAARGGFFASNRTGLDTKNEFIAAIKKHYSGPVVMGEPLMVFDIGDQNPIGNK